MKIFVIEGPILVGQLLFGDAVATFRLNAGERVEVAEDGTCGCEMTADFTAHLAKVWRGPDGQLRHDLRHPTGACCLSDRAFEARIRPLYEDREREQI